jgi:hypothetical protein
MTPDEVAATIAIFYVLLLLMVILAVVVLFQVFITCSHQHSFTFI